MSKQDKNDDLTGKIGTRMTLFAWIIVLGMLTILFSGQLEQQRNPNQTVNSLINSNETEVTLRQNRYGHYIATAEFNHTPVDVIVDTGATDVSVPLTVARQLGLKRGTKMDVSTANGTISVYSTRIDSIKLGDIIVHDVRADINPYMEDDVVLLGMSFLDQLEFSHSNNELVLKQVYK